MSAAPPPSRWTFPYSRAGRASHPEAPVKRTYNLHEATVRHVREMSSEYAVAHSQDAVVELAVERLYQEALDRVEAERWTAATVDQPFVAEIRGIAADLDGDAPWPA